MNCTRSDIWARRTLEALRMFLNPRCWPDPKDKIEQQNLLHMATMAAEEGETEKGAGGAGEGVAIGRKLSAGAETTWAGWKWLPGIMAKPRGI